MATATASDIKGVIDTTLTDSELESFADDAEFEASQAIADYQTALSTAERTQLEKYLAALLIRGSKEKGVSNQSAESRSLSYNGMTLSELRVAVSKRDPSNTLATSALRDADRYVNSTNIEHET